ncbi:pentatricopeptide repeat-containing protein At2g44880 [Neltuma alba]|uniref:pentatricopeptide repeat-containing protein At2g44880 n=1 Tax=Neltuma alba TaxID=207710 RepID=UPI0010A31485|nr:pentatricopeptide repeat-containing protein At2g44880 [Prosopis alba]XP_028793152.1 pentatricopeptide repeat-containing protein At2g44880 [Prosopis alba]XP_028793153.1 pentatricopeptide repeat-containing protein At2g44880 [Prosopis alba]XP_028793155.1 pentatricopeptide repeat-containing protein At2g44880 [Prosopis alba]XP_028793156.1 pentatricopeptide repeat-containing protein At2g44880 [Prosopis alba]XP_028793157.1 pentatricopeptide repeat-containing protein At2g44880 [Prosopis alba]XP_02
MSELWSSIERRCLYLLQENNSMASLLQIHAFMLRNALNYNVNLLTKFISSLSSLALAASSLQDNPIGITRHAHRVFDQRPHKGDAFLCNSMMRAYLAGHQCIESLTLYRDLRRETGFNPDKYTFTILAKCCTMNMAITEGEEIHGGVVKSGIFLNLHVSTALVDMYAKFGFMGSACKVFNEMAERSQVSWTALVVGYARCGDMNKARKLFEQMSEKDSAAFNAMIDGYVKLGIMGLAQDLFDKMPNKNVISWTSMISGYCHDGDVEYARLMFDNMPEKNLFSWNAMIGGYCQNKQPNKALELFYEMQRSESAEPNEITVSSILGGIADLGALDLGIWVHNFSQRKGLDKSGRVCTALVDMYAKCGEITKAKLVFDKIIERGVASWNALITGFAANGRAKEALKAFAGMIKEGLKPNEITMIGVLSACNHCGLVEEGKRWFQAIEKFSLTPQIEHYGCMVDLLGRAGCLDEAEKIIKNMPYNANGIILSSFLFACGCHKDVARGERVLKEVVKMDQLSGGDYVMLRNMYATEQRWIDMEDVKYMMKNSGSNKEVGCSVIGVNSGFAEFVAGDCLHPHQEIIHLTLGQLWKHMKVDMIY